MARSMSIQKKAKRVAPIAREISICLPLFCLNHVDTLDSYKTFAHEMGHAIHTELSKKQPVIYQNYTISVAEVASTFFEKLLLKKFFQSFQKRNRPSLFMID
jgi:oligoendopeptidase F